MKEKNIKGFTLLELIVAMAIFTIVIFVGYKIIDKSVISTKTQLETNKGQLNMNDMNNYLTKDLEQVVDIEMEIINAPKIESLESGYNQVVSKLQNGDNVNYKYKLKFRDMSENYFYHVYNVDIHDKKYTISTIDKNGVIVEFSSNESLIDEKIPFSITGENPYKVSMGYSNKINKFNAHEFQVVSRMNDVESMVPDPDPDPEPPTPPEDLNPPIVDERFNLDTLGCIGFWAANPGKKGRDNLYVWHKMYNKNMNIGGGQFGTQPHLYSGNYNISSKVGIGNNNKDDFAYIKDTFGGEAKVSISFDNHTLPSKDDVYLQVYVSKGVKFNITKLNNVEGNSENGSILYPQGTVLEGEENGKVYSLIRVGHGKNLNVSGYIDLNGHDDGYVVIMYGNIKK